MSNNINFDKAGYVYVMSNPCFNHLVKIGFTKRSPFDRLNELNNTSVPDDFMLVHYEVLEDAEFCEKLLHERLSEERYNPDREFFKVSTDEAKYAIRQVQRDLRERLFSKTKEDFSLLNNKGKPSLVMTHDYSNPRAVELIEHLFELEDGKFLNSEQVAKKLKISEKGVLAIVRFFDNCGIKVLYAKDATNDSLIMRLHISFKVAELKVFMEKYPNLDLDKLLEKFESKFSKKNSKAA